VENAARFQAPDVVAAYPQRVPYPDEVFDILAELIEQSVAAGDGSRAALDIGTGDGSIARHLAARANQVERVDAVDVSAPMLALARTLPGGAQPNLRWILGPAETAPLGPPYALATAGESLHWMDWETTLPRLAAALTPHGMLAIAHRTAVDRPWQADVDALIRRYSTMRDYEEHDLIALLTERGLFEKIGERTTAPTPFTQSIADNIEALHSMSSLARSAMPAADVATCDDELRAILAPHADAGGLLHMLAVGDVIWGRPLLGGR
jgi:SAM-dependent methyltransferase